MGSCEGCAADIGALQVVGSSTACIAALDSHSEMLQAVNIGDSGLYVFSRGQDTAMAGTMKSNFSQDELHIVYRSRQQLHSFNRPYQLGYAPSSSEEKAIFAPYFESPEDATLMNIPVAAGDLVNAV